MQLLLRLSDAAQGFSDAVKGCSALDELAFLHKPSSTLILTDLAFNLSKSDGRVGWLSKLYLSWYGGYQPCCVTSPFKGLFNDPGATVLWGSLGRSHAVAAFHAVAPHQRHALQVSVAHGDFIPNNGKQTFKDGSYAFVDQLVKQQSGQTSAGDNQSSKMPGIAAGVTAAAALIATAVGIGVAGIMQTRQQ
eukprot:gene2679-2980_t